MTFKKFTPIRFQDSQLFALKELGNGRDSVGEDGKHLRALEATHSRNSRFSQARHSVLRHNHAIERQSRTGHAGGRAFRTLHWQGHRPGTRHGSAWVYLRPSRSIPAQGGIRPGTQAWKTPGGNEEVRL